MSERADGDLQDHQREVQRLLGRCTLRLQQYERLVKIIVAHHDLTGPAYALYGAGGSHPIAGALPDPGRPVEAEGRNELDLLVSWIHQCTTWA